MAILKDKEKYILDLRVAKLGKEDYCKVSMTCGGAEESQQDFLHVLKPSDGTVMRMYNHVEFKIR